MVTQNREETIEFAEKLAKKLRGGKVLALNGDLGSGKTTFMKGLAKGLGVKEVITSPTFVILKEYNIKPSVHLRGVRYKVKKLVHIDAYRVENIEDIRSASIEDYLHRQDVILAIEWPEKISGILPKNHIKIKFKTISENQRQITMLNVA